MDMNLNNNACKYTNVYNRGKNSNSKIVDTHLAFLKSSKHWSSVVIQRLVDNHTNYIISFRAKCEAGREVMSTGLPATSCDNLDSYTLNEHGGL